MKKSVSDNFEEGFIPPRLTADGLEIPDPTPMSLPSGFKRPDTLADQVRRLVRSERLAEAAAARGLETFAESEDFEVDEDMDPFTPYELAWDPVLGKDIAPADFNDPVKRDYFKALYLEAERNAIRADARQEAIEAAYARSRGVQGNPPAPRPKPPKAAPEAE